MLAVFALQNAPHPSKLQTVARLLDFWDALYPHLSPGLCAQPKEVSRADEYRVQMMLQYIHTHYRDNIRLEDIAQEVYIGKSTALRIFQKYIHQSPVAYLIQYRLKQAAALLKSTEKKIVAIAEETGFQSDGYFCRRFKALYGVSPQTYRRTAAPHP